MGQLIKEFHAFLREYKIVPLAIAFIIGAAATSLVKSFVDSVIMPLITPFVPNGAWQTATFALGNAVIAWGAFLGAAINFVIIALVVFLIAKFLLREEQVSKK